LRFLAGVDLGKIRREKRMVENDLENTIGQQNGFHGVRIVNELETRHQFPKPSANSGILKPLRSLPKYRFSRD